MADLDFEALAQPALRGLKAYDPGLDIVALRARWPAGRLVELGSNENSHGPGPAARAAVLDTLHSLHRYPDPLGGGLKRALSALHGVPTHALMLGNGSHELLMMLAQAFAGPGRGVVSSVHGFAVYGLAAAAAGAPHRRAAALPREHAMSRGHDAGALAAAIGPDTALLYLANPNNPTGTWMGRDELARLLGAVPREVIVVVDEAYHEYATDPGLGSALELCDRHPNLVVTRTFSKAHGLAGLRIGYLVGHPGLVAVLERLRESFNANGPGLAACEAALGDRDHLAWVRRTNAAEREALSDALRARGLGVGPSQTNFLLVDFDHPAGPVEAGLVARGVVPRPMAGYGLPTCLRLTVGTRDENRRLLQALDEVME